MADVETDLLQGLAQALADAGCGTYSATPGASSIVFGDLPTSPDRAIALNLYAAVDEGVVPLSTLRLQVMVRGNVNASLDPAEVAGPVFAFLEGLQHQQYGTAHLNLAHRVSRIPLGVDGNKRSLRADNYELSVDMPATAGRPG